jgi:hypothetical protein
MHKFKLIGAVVAFAVAMPLVLADSASAAAKKAAQVPYDQAWTRCKAQVDKLPWDQHSARYTRGASCMQRFGYKL